MSIMRVAVTGPSVQAATLHNPPTLLDHERGSYGQPSRAHRLAQCVSRRGLPVHLRYQGETRRAQMSSTFRLLQKAGNPRRVEFDLRAPAFRFHARAQSKFRKGFLSELSSTL